MSGNNVAAARARREAIRDILASAELPMTVDEILEALLERGYLQGIVEQRRVTLYTCSRMVKEGTISRFRKSPFRPDVHGNAVVFDCILPF